MNTNPCDILIVEDNATDAEPTLRALRRANLANPVTVVEDGSEALEYPVGAGKYAGRSDGTAPRVVLLDLELPILSGLEVLRRIRENERTRELPVVIATSSRVEAEIEEAYRLGVSSYIVEPVEFAKFVDAMAHVGS